MKMTTKIAKFEIGKTYYCRASCDYDCIYPYTVVTRTAKTVTLKDLILGDTSRRKIFNSSFSGNEYCLPKGSYSMAPCLDAKDILTSDVYKKMGIINPEAPLDDDNAEVDHSE